MKSCRWCRSGFDAPGDLCGKCREESIVNIGYAVEVRADTEGRHEYRERRHDVDVCGKDPSWAWPLVDADAEYIARVGIPLICNQVGLRVEQWQTWGIPWIVSFRKGYEAEHAEYLRENGDAT